MKASEESMKAPLSAIDIGSNAIRMIVGRVIDGQIQVIKKYRAPIRLGKDVFRQGAISEKTLAEAEAAFVRFAAINRKLRVQKCRAVATSAVREAKNGPEFVKRVLKSSKIPIEIIDGVEEARLIHTAVRREVDLSRRRLLLIDIGGGSVEITFSENGLMTATQSFPIGTVRLLQFLTERNLSEKGLRVVLGEFVASLSSYIESHARVAPLELAVGTGGNIECMGALKVQLLGRSPKTYVSLGELVEISTRLERLSVKERIEKLDLRPDRADVIVPAVLLVKTILRQAGAEKLLIPGVGLRDGLLWSLTEG